MIARIHKLNLNPIRVPVIINKQNRSRRGLPWQRDFSSICNENWIFSYWLLITLDYLITSMNKYSPLLITITLVNTHRRFDVGGGEHSANGQLLKVTLSNSKTILLKLYLNYVIATLASTNDYYLFIVYITTTTTTTAANTLTMLSVTVFFHARKKI